MPISLQEKYGLSPLMPIVKSQIKKMVDEYKKHQQTDSTQSLKHRFPKRPDIEETRWTWVSKSEIIQLLNDNPGSDGIRIYFGAHDASTINNLGYEYQGQITVILVTTQSQKGADGTVIANKDLLNEDSGSGVVNSVSFLPNEPFGSYTGMGSDNYPLCPPNCPPGALLWP